MTNTKDEYKLCTQEREKPLQLEWWGTWKSGRSGGNDEDGRKHSRTRKRKRQSGKWPGVLDRYKQTWLARVKDPSWEQKVRSERSTVDGLPQQAGRMCGISGALWTGQWQDKEGDKRHETVQLLNIQRDHEDLSPSEGCGQRGWSSPSSQPYALRPHRPPSLPSTMSPVLSGQLFSGSASFITQLPVLKRPSLSAPPIILCPVSHFMSLLHRHSLKLRHFINIVTSLLPDPLHLTPWGQGHSPCHWQHST